MIYIYVEKWDICGEGMRAELLIFSGRAAADAEYQRLTSPEVVDKEQVAEVRMLVGSQLKHWQLDPSTGDRELTSDELNTSMLEDIPDTDTKENI